jgi:hypothetical protein
MAEAARALGWPEQIVGCHPRAASEHHENADPSDGSSESPGTDIELATVYDIANNQWPTARNSQNVYRISPYHRRKPRRRLGSRGRGLDGCLGGANQITKPDDRPVDDAVEAKILARRAGRHLA